MQRYQVARTPSPHTVWRSNHKRRSIPAAKTPRVEVLAPAVVHWSADDWQHVRDWATHDTGLTVHVADLPVAELTAGSRISFTFYWPTAARWEGVDFVVTVEGDPVATPVGRTD